MIKNNIIFLSDDRRVLRTQLSLFTVQALFIASGPEFLHNIQPEPFHNIELYNLMCHLTGVEPSPNNGTMGSLYHILAQPPEYPKLPKVRIKL